GLADARRAGTRLGARPAAGVAGVAGRSARYGRLSPLTAERLRLPGPGLAGHGEPGAHRVHAVGEAGLAALLLLRVSTSPRIYYPDVPLMPSIPFSTSWRAWQPSRPRPEVASTPPRTRGGIGPSVGCDYAAAASGCSRRRWP